MDDRALEAPQEARRKSRQRSNQRAKKSRKKAPKKKQQTRRSRCSRGSTIMRMRHPRLRWLLPWYRRAARRDRNRPQHPHLSLSRQKPRHPQRGNRDHERRAVVAVAEVVAEVVRGRERRQQYPQSPQKRPEQKRPYRNQW